jgi:hypothetical protein
VTGTRRYHEPVDASASDFVHDRSPCGKPAPLIRPVGATIRETAMHPQHWQNSPTSGPGAPGRHRYMDYANRRIARIPEPGATPAMRQFLEIKAANPGALLFYRMGDFYELFFEDAVIASAALNITLTKRGKHQGEDDPHVRCAGSAC